MRLCLLQISMASPLLLLQVAHGQSTVNEGKCKLCDTDLPSSATRSNIIPELEIPGAPNPTCQDAQDYALTVDADSVVCSMLQSQAAFCGCTDVTPPTEPCSLCPNGNAPPRTDLVITDAGETCGDLATYLSFLSNDECQTTDRGQALMRYAFACGCDGATTQCAMCPDGTIDMANPDAVIPFFSLVDGIGNPTCQDVAIIASSSPQDEIDCTLIQQQAGFCGCTNIAPKNACSLCPEGASPTKPDLEVETTDTCLELDEYMSYMDETSCNSGQASNIQALGFVCGCPGVEAQCSLCPNGDAPPDPYKVVNPQTGATCGMLAQNAAGLTATKCADQRGSILGISAARCDCEDAHYPVCR